MVRDMRGPCFLRHYARSLMRLFTYSFGEFRGSELYANRSLLIIQNTQGWARQGRKLHRKDTCGLQFPTVPFSEKDFPRTLSCQPHMTRYYWPSLSLFTCCYGSVTGSSGRLVITRSFYGVVFTESGVSRRVWAGFLVFETGRDTGGEFLSV